MLSSINVVKHSLVLHNVVAVMEFAVDECNVYRLLLGFLEDRGMYDSLIQLSLESGVSLTETDEELSYLQDLVLTGRLVFIAVIYLGL